MGKMHAQTIPEVIGQNVKRIRGKKTLEELADIARSMGAEWSAGSISAIERGKFKPTIDTVLTIVNALTLAGSPTSFSDLLISESPIQITSTTFIGSSELIAFVEGRLVGPLYDVDRSRPTAAEVRMAKKVGISPQELRERSIEKWGVRIEEKRDSIAGAEATPQKRGRITRNLLTELTT